MLANLFVLALIPLVAAHGKVALVTGDGGGNVSALAIQGGVVPGPGKNKVTETDTTVFKSTNLMTDGLGRTTGGGKVAVADLKQAQALSGPTLPQVNKEISGVFHVVTTDGCGPIKAVLDPTATGTFSNGVPLTTTKDVPGNNGNCPKSLSKKSLLTRMLESAGIIAPRATNVNKDFPMAFNVPAGTACTGTVNGIQNVCLVKIANNNKAGPFGGVAAVQMAGSGGAAPAPGTNGAAAPARARAFAA